MLDILSSVRLDTVWPAETSTGEGDHHVDEDNHPKSGSDGQLHVLQPEEKNLFLEGCKRVREDTHHIDLCKFLLVVLKVTELAERFSVLSISRSSFSPLSMITSMLATMMPFTCSTSSWMLVILSWDCGVLALLISLAISRLNSVFMA